MRFIIFFSLVFCCVSICIKSVDGDMGQRASLLRNVFIGLINATAENLVTQPLDIIKNYDQQNHGFKPIRLGWRALYRGFAANTSSYAPTIAIQTAVHGAAENYMNPLASSTSAGFFSAFITAPTESIVIHQQNTGLKLIHVLNKLKREKHLHRLFRGLIPTMIRESSFAGGYLVCVQKAKEFIAKKYGIDNRIALAFIAGLPVGLSVAALTQPADTIKTIMQGNYQENTTLIQECKKLYGDSGAKGFYRGFGARSAIVAISITLLNEFNILLHQLLN
jgi:hypothetical protein